MRVYPKKIKVAGSALTRAALTCLLALAGACRTASPPQPELVPISWSDAPPFVDDGSKETFLAAIAQSRAWLASRPAGTMLGVTGHKYPAAALDSALGAVEAQVARTGLDAAFTRLLPQLFDVYETRAPGKPAPVLATGYYVPLIDGSFVPNPAYKVPVYGVPGDLVAAALEDFDGDLPRRKLRGRVVKQRLVPYFDRQEIREKPDLMAGAPVVAWVKDEVDLFVVEVQGSGIVRDDSGAQRVIGYADENGRPYRAVGKLLLDEHKIPHDELSMAAIRAYLRAHPAEVRRVLAYNPSFVFFRLGREAVVGSLGKPLTPGRSVATDQRIMPSGALGFISVERPSVAGDGKIAAQGRIERFIFNQDSGGAIRGAGRVDFFWGAGSDAERLASAMQHRGRLFFLVPRTAGQPP